MSKDHFYKLNIRWTGNKGSGTSSYTAYERSHDISAGSKQILHASSDPAFRGDPEKYNPEELFLSSISTCHMLWFLHLCADKGIIVTEYTDRPEGIMTETPGQGGKFREVTLHPEVIITEKEKIPMLDDLHEEANTKCFISNSLNFRVRHEGRYSALDDASNI